ncbi:bacteriohemerythrin [Pseudodesulfovibrio sp.]|nr:bacteriohemerythrin [Pseudodesulfovibrio sp.]
MQTAKNYGNSHLNLEHWNTVVWFMEKMIEWIDKFSVGIPSIDKQHKKLIGLIAKLQQSVLDGLGLEGLLILLLELEEYTGYHFDYEERVLEKHGYPKDKLEAHIQEHEEITEIVSKHIAEFSQKKEMLDIKVLHFLMDWTDEHMTGTDMEYSDFLKSKGLV